MAKIRNAKAKNSSGSYARVFNHQPLGDLITKIHSTAIANGNELESLILEHIADEYIVKDCDEFLQNFKNTNQNSDKNGDIVK